MGGLSSIVDAFTGEGGAEASLEAGELQSQALRDAIPGVESAVSTAQEGLAPFSEAGERSIQQQQALLGLLGNEQQSQALSTISESPSEQFVRRRQERALLRNSGAIGGLGGGNVRTALQEQAAGFGATDINNRINQINRLTGQGLTAAGASGELGVRGAETVGELGVAAAGADASGLLGAADARAQGVQNLATLGTNAATLSLLSDKDKKTDIKDMDLKACYDTVINMPLKSWRYLEETGLDQDVHFGPLAQEAPECIKIPYEQALNLHDELMLIAGAIQYLRTQSWH